VANCGTPAKVCADRACTQQELPSAYLRHRLPAMHIWLRVRFNLLGPARLLTPCLRHMPTSSLQRSAACLCHPSLAWATTKNNSHCRSRCTSVMTASGASRCHSSRTECRPQMCGWHSTRRRSRSTTGSAAALVRHAPLCSDAAAERDSLPPACIADIPHQQPLSLCFGIDSHPLCPACSRAAHMSPLLPRFVACLFLP
jgi:hypothetical protein